VESSLVDLMEERGRRTIPKAKLQIWVTKSSNFFDLMNEEEDKKTQSRPSAPEEAVPEGAPQETQTAEKPAEEDTKD